MQKDKTELKLVQKESREASDKRGTNGRHNHKGKAHATNKPYGGKMAR